MCIHACRTTDTSLTPPLNDLHFYDFSHPAGAGLLVCQPLGIIHSTHNLLCPGTHSRHGRRAVVGREVLVSSGFQQGKRKGCSWRRPAQIECVGWVVLQGVIGNSSQSCIHATRSGGLIITIGVITMM